MGITVTIIDDSDYVGVAAAVTRTGELTMTSVSDMVTKIIRHLTTYTPPPSPHDLLIGPMSHGRVRTPTPTVGAKMSRLNILDHGSPTGVQIGTDWVTAARFATFQPTLARLRSHFDTGAMVHLQHCDAGQNVPLMEMFADTFGVPVVAGRGAHNPVYRMNFGDYVRVYPAGPGGTRRASDTFFWGPSNQ